jgi:hypothetical protein
MVGLKTSQALVEDGHAMRENRPFFISFKVSTQQLTMTNLKVRIRTEISSRKFSKTISTSRAITTCLTWTRERWRKRIWYASSFLLISQ